jgi:hypothetical protein
MRGCWLASIAIVFLVLLSMVLYEGSDGGDPSRRVHQMGKFSIVGDAEIPANTGCGSQDEEPFVRMGHRN